MRRRRVLGAALGLVAALALSPVGAAAPRSCNLASFNCIGLGWFGRTSQGGIDNTGTGGGISFVTDLTKRSIGNFQWAIGNEHCTATGTASLPIAMGFGVAQGGWQVRVVGGHFSKRWTLVRPVFATRQFPTTVVWHLTGTISGNQASGTMQWSFAGPTKEACTPSSGSFTWHAKNGGKVGNA